MANIIVIVGLGCFVRFLPLGHFHEGHEIARIVPLRVDLRAIDAHRLVAIGKSHRNFASVGFFAHGLAADCVAHTRSQRCRQDVVDIVCRFALWRVDETANRADIVMDRPVVIDHHACRRIAIEQRPAHLLAEIARLLAPGLLQEALDFIGTGIGTRARGELGGGAPRLAFVDVRLARQRLEFARLRRDVFGGAEDQVARLLEREVEGLDQLLLMRRIEIDHQIAAGHEVEPRKGRICEHILLGEHHALAQALLDPVVLVFLAEILAQSLGRDVGGDAMGIEPFATLRDGIFVEVGGEYLPVAIARLRGAVLFEQDRQAVGFLAARAGRHPYPDRFIARFFDQGGNHLLFDLRPDLKIAEERGHVDQHVVGQLAQLVRVGPQVFEIF